MTSLQHSGYRIHREVFDTDEIAHLRSEADRVATEAGSACVRHLNARSYVFQDLSISKKNLRSNLIMRIFAPSAPFSSIKPLLKTGLSHGTRVWPSAQSKKYPPRDTALGVTKTESPTYSLRSHC